MGLEHRGILRIGYVRLGLTDLGAAEAFYRDRLGLLVTERATDRVYLRCWHEPFRYTLVLEETDTNRLIEIGLEVRDTADLDDLADRLNTHGLSYTREGSGDAPLGIADSLVMTAPSGHRLRVVPPLAEPGYITGYASPDWNVPKPLRATPAPFFLGHVALTAPDVPTAVRFFRDVLGFGVSEAIQRPDGQYLSALLYRTTNGQDLALFPGPAGGLHHVAFVKMDETDILTAGEYLAEEGVRIDRYGPTVQPYGKTFSLYFFDPFGTRLEFFSGGRYTELHPEFQPVIWTEARLQKALSFHDSFLNEEFLQPSFTATAPVANKA
jgi:catechol 2,3-dioxygenase